MKTKIFYTSKQAALMEIIQKAARLFGLYITEIWEYRWKKFKNTQSERPTTHDPHSANHDQHSAARNLFQMLLQHLIQLVTLRKAAVQNHFIIYDQGRHVALVAIALLKIASGAVADRAAVAEAESFQHFQTLVIARVAVTDHLSAACDEDRLVNTVCHMNLSFLFGKILPRLRAGGQSLSFNPKHNPFIRFDKHLRFIHFSSVPDE